MDQAEATVAKLDVAKHAKDQAKQNADEALKKAQADLVSAQE